MSLTIQTKEENGITVISLIGNLDSNTASDADAEINQWLIKNVHKMVINLIETKYVSSAGLRVFLATAKKMSATGGILKFCSPNDVVREILEISGFTTILDVKGTLEEAMNEI